ncbi:MAG TPA: diguanylate cyclase [Gaiellaceae bacterium]|nr:diguanylate cyclase [Gaiellaceae bacterium]
MSDSTEKSILGFSPRLFAYVAGITGLAVPALAIAGAHLASTPPSGRNWLGIGLFLALSLGADFRPVPLDENGNNVSLAFVFIIASRLIFGWDVGIIIAAISIAPSEILRRSAPLRTSFNSAAYAIAAASAGITSLFGSYESNDVLRLTLYAFLSGMIFIFVNTAVVAGAVSLSDDMPYGSAFSTLIRMCGGAFTVMAFLAALAANLWNIRPELLVLLAGPLFALTLYQRTALRSRIAVRDANTDNLTGLGNHRAYQAVLRTRIDEAERMGAEFSLGIVDVDDFKRINDTYGHQVGDDVLVALAEILRDATEAEAYRCGGDEFALIFDGDGTGAFGRVTEIQEAVAGLGLTPVTISVGIASYPSQASDADSLQRMADGALYWSKHHGKNRSFVYSPKVVRIHSAKELEWETERMARLRAAKNIVRFVDAKDPSTANHSETVSALAAAIGVQLGLDENTIDQLALGGLLHDIGKIGIPDAVLQAPRALTPEEFEAVKTHPALGYSLLEGLGIAPIDEWILHHHEDCGGHGYPDGLVGDEIPLGARIIRVADAFEAMTANRPYRPAQSVEYALGELHANTGTQFERSAVLALEACLASAPTSDKHRAALAFALA